jgi:hypothetical protein
MKCYVRRLWAKLASMQSSGKSAVPSGIDRPTFTWRKRKFGSKDSSAVRNAELKAVRRLPAVRAGQGWPLRLCASCGAQGSFAAGAPPGPGPVINAAAAVASCIFGGKLGFEVP